MEIPKDRLATTDEFGDRVYLYPAEVQGFWRRRRDWTQAVLVILFLILPWIKIGGHQAVLLSIPERRFAFFGLTFYAHDGPLLLFVLGALVMGLAFATAVWGRVWCGWACPQTVFIDGVFRRIERFIEGTHLERRKLDRDPLSFSKLFKKSLKWLLFFMVASAIAHSFTAYFIGAERLARMSLHSPSENWVDFIIVSFITLVLLFDFGWFREQFCIIMCPYGRFQSVFMDRGSVAVMYDENRGEPRKGSEEYKNRQGDCVNCSRCVQVCPTGIDIRRGLQMECIACTACIDACDEIMDKVNKPRGLIRYSSIVKMAGESVKKMTVRAALYLGLALISLSGLAYSVAFRLPLHAAVLRVQGAPYRLLQGDEKAYVVNQFKVHLQNQTAHEMRVQFSLLLAEGQDISLIQQAAEVLLAPGEIQTHLLFVKFNQKELGGLGQLLLPLKIAVPASSYEQVQNLKLLGP